MASVRPAAVIVLAAGEGTRMKSATAKVLHEIGGRSLLGHSIAAAQGTDPEHVVVVVRHQRDQVAAHVASLDPRIVVADQDNVKGTGRACECGLAVLPPDLEGTVVITYGDVPLLEAGTLRDLVQTHVSGGSAVSILTARLEDPTGYGRVLRDASGAVLRIVEQKDASADERQIGEVNSGIYAFDAAVLRAVLPLLGTANAQGEKYLTDVIALAREAGHPVSAHVVDDLWQTEGVNDRAQLARLGGELNRRLVHRAMLSGVTVIDPTTTWLDVGVTVGADTTLLPNTHLGGGTTVGSRCVIGPDTSLVDVVVDEGAVVARTHGFSSRIGAGATVGPFAYLRPGTHLGADGKIGTFVETKNAVIGAGSKVPHLSYVGDATIGEDTNIGAASVFVNFDGVSKNHTVVGDHCRMGSDNMYVAPLHIGDGAYSGAGTVIRKDVPAGALAITVAPQRNVPGWVIEHRPDSAAAQAAAAASQTVQGESA